MGTHIILAPQFRLRFLYGTLLAIGALCLPSAKDSMAQNQPLTKGTPGQQPPALAGGRQIFESSCSGCHGLDGRGAERATDISTRPQVLQR